MGVQVIGAENKKDQMGEALMGAGVQMLTSKLTGMVKGGGAKAGEATDAKAAAGGGPTDTPASKTVGTSPLERRQNRVMGGVA